MWGGTVRGSAAYPATPESTQSLVFFGHNRLLDYSYTTVLLQPGVELTSAYFGCIPVYKVSPCPIFIFCFATSQAFSLDEQRASCRYAVRVSPFSRPRTCPKLGAPPHRPRKTPKQCVSPVQMNREARLCTPRNGICYSRVPIFNEVDND